MRDEHKAALDWILITTGELPADLDEPSDEFDDERRALHMLDEQTARSDALAARLVERERDLADLRRQVADLEERLRGESAAHVVNTYIDHNGNLFSEVHDPPARMTEGTVRRVVREELRSVLDEYEQRLRLMSEYAAILRGGR